MKENFRNDWGTAIKTGNVYRLEDWKIEQIVEHRSEKGIVAQVKFRLKEVEDEK